MRLFKSLLFLGAGAISNATHSVDLNELGGLQLRMPLTGAGVLIGCCSIAGLPLFNGFVSEWLTFRSLLAGSSLVDTKAQILLPLMVGILALIGGVAAACFVQVFGVAFLGRPRSVEAEHAQEAPLGMRVALLLLAAGCIGIGILPGLLLRPLVSLVQVLIPGAGVPEETLSIARVMPWIAATIVGTGTARRFAQTAGKNRPDVGVRSSGAFEPHAVHLHRVLETDSFCLLASLQTRS